MSSLSVLLGVTDVHLKAFDFAIELAKQLLTLSIGILGISITFTKDLFKNISSLSKILLGLSWVFFFFSILFGILHIMGLTGSLEGVTDSTPATIGSPARFFGGCQIISFGIATLLIVIYGIRGLKKNVPSQELR